MDSVTKGQEFGKRYHVMASSINIINVCNVHKRLRKSIPAHYFGFICLSVATPEDGNDGIFLRNL